MATTCVHPPGPAQPDATAPRGPWRAVHPDQLLLIALLTLLLAGLAVLALALAAYQPGPAWAPGRLPSPSPGPPVATHMTAGHGAPATTAPSTDMPASTQMPSHATTAHQ